MIRWQTYKFTLSFSYLVVLAFSFFLLGACATSDRVLTEAQKKQEEEATKNCLKNPDKARTWGECNQKKVVHNRIPQIRRCYEQKLGEEMQFEGDVVLRFRVYKSGRVRDVRIDQGSLKNKFVSDCLLKETAKVRFAAPPEDYGNVVYFPFLLEKLNRPQAMPTK